MTPAEMFEARVLTNLHLTSHQKTILALIASASDQMVSDQDISKGPNLSNARKMLIKLGLIEEREPGRFGTTDKGVEVAKAENVVDEAGGLTDEGQRLAFPADDQKDQDPVGTEPPMALETSMSRLRNYL